MKICFCAVLLYPGKNEDIAQRKDEEQDRDVHEWNATLQLYTDVTPPSAQAQAVDDWQQPVTGLLSPDGSHPTDRSACPSPQVTACHISI